MATSSLSTEIVTLASEYHQDPVLAAKIISCESRAYGAAAIHDNIDSHGNVWSTDIGPWQINDYYHKARAESMGLNIYNTVDNLRYGFILMDEQGTAPWKASKYCWSK